ncbi:MAG: hypothetical protein AAB561_01580 [Patescibacteria group bacterium]
MRRKRWMLRAVAHCESGCRRVAREPSGSLAVLICPNKKSMIIYFLMFLHHTLRQKNVKTFDQAMRFAAQITSKNIVTDLQKGEIYIVSAGVPFGKSGSTNLLLAQRV